MAVPATPKLSQVIAEFIAPATTKLSQFLRGGAYVPNTAQNNAVPTALPIRLLQMAGAVRYVPHSATNSPSSSNQTTIPDDTLIDELTCNPVNGIGPFTYAWSHDMGAAGPSITNPTLKTATISRYRNGTFSLSGTVTCVSTDTGSGDSHQASSGTSIDWNWTF